MAKFRWKRIKSIDAMERFYKSLIPKLKLVAREHGYCLAIHGSLRRDFDMLAVPWVDEHSTRDELANALQFAACGLVQLPEHPMRWTAKPCGRKATSFPICWIEFDYDRNTVFSLGHIDLSIMPRTEEK